MGSGFPDSKLTTIFFRVTVPGGKFGRYNLPSLVFFSGLFAVKHPGSTIIISHPLDSKISTQMGVLGYRIFSNPVLRKNITQVEEKG